MATQTNETKLALMQKDVEYIKKELGEVKTYVQDGFEKIQSNFEDDQKAGAQRFVARTEFESVKEEVGNLRRGVIFVVGTVIAAVIAAILRLVLIQ